MNGHVLVRIIFFRAQYRPYSGYVALERNLSICSNVGHWCYEKCSLSNMTKFSVQFWCHNNQLHAQEIMKQCYMSNEKGSFVKRFKTIISSSKRHFILIAFL